MDLCSRNSDSFLFGVVATIAKPLAAIKARVGTALRQEHDKLTAGKEIDVRREVYQVLVPGEKNIAKRELRKENDRQPFKDLVGGWGGIYPGSKGHMCKGPEAGINVMCSRVREHPNSSGVLQACYGVQEYRVKVKKGGRVLF